MAVDTALFVVSGGDTKEESSLVGFTEQRDKEVSRHMSASAVSRHRLKGFKGENTDTER